jgi:hypothetical protein
MAGWNTIQTIRKLEERAELLGMRFTAYKHDDLYGENVALIPKDLAALPIYSRDAILFAGSLEAADKFMQGILWARDYDRMLKVSDVKKRERKEQDERNKQMIRLLKSEKNTLVNT